MRMHLCRVWCVCFAVLVVASCGGGGGDGGGGGGGGGGADDADATGIWRGTATPDGGAASNALAIVSADGEFILTAASIFLDGSGSTRRSSFSASATGWPPVGQTFPNGSGMANFSLTGNVAERSSISGSYSGANLSGTISLTYDGTLTIRAASLSTVGGSYSSADGVVSIAISGNTITMNAATGPSNNCTGNGTISIPEPSQNIYKWSMTLAGCNVNGSADGLATIPVTNFLSLLGRLEDVPFSMIVNK